MDDIKNLVARSYDTWNAHDLDGWLSCFDETVTFRGPGGLTGKGYDTARMFWSIWQDAFPDCRNTITVAVAEGNDAIQEAVFSGTHTNVMRAPNREDIPPTGKTVTVPYALRLTYRDGKFSTFDLIFDQLEMMTQLGLVSNQAPVGA
jgi:ketosteroid isomerase-like protein